MPSPTKTKAEPQTKSAPAPTIQKQPEAPEPQAGPSPAVQTMATALPPPNGKPAAARAADMMTGPARTSPLQRARMIGGMQRSVGNARMARLMGESGDKSQAEIPSSASPGPSTAASQPSSTDAAQTAATLGPTEQSHVATHAVSAAGNPQTPPSEANAAAQPGLTGQGMAAMKGTAPSDSGTPQNTMTTGARQKDTALAVASSTAVAGPGSPTAKPATLAQEASASKEKGKSTAIATQAAPKVGPMSAEGKKVGIAQDEAAQKSKETRTTAEEKATAESKVKEGKSKEEGEGKAAKEASPSEAPGGADLAATAGKAVAPGAPAGGETQAGPAAGGGAPAAPTAEGGADEGGGGDGEAAADELEARMEEAAPEATEDAEADAVSPERKPALDTAAATPTSRLESVARMDAEPNPGSTTSDASAEERALDTSASNMASGGAATPAAASIHTAEPETTINEGADESAVAPESNELSPAERNVAMESLAEQDGGGGEPGGGGGGGGAINEKPLVQAPDVSSQEPEAALAAISKLPPAQLQSALGSVSSSVNRSVGEQRADLKSNPPAMERPTGAPQTKEQTGAGPELGGERAKGKVERAPEGQAKPTPVPEPLPTPPASPAEAVREPQVAGTPKGEMSEADVSRLKSSINQMPTRDPGLDVDGGPPPKVELTGNADPAQAQQQQAELNKNVEATHAEGRNEVAVRMGEDRVFPTVPNGEMLRARVPEAGGGRGAGAGGPPATGMAGGGGAEQEAASIIAQEKKGGEIQAAIAKAQGEMAAKRQDYTTKSTEERAKAKEEIEKANADNTAEQTAVRQQVQQDVEQQRGEWSKAQEDEVSKADTEAKKAYDGGMLEVNERQTRADVEAAGHIQKGNAEAEHARRQAEQEAEAQKRKAQQESSSGFFSRLVNKAKAFFNGIKNAIKVAFDAARKLVKAAIETAKKLAVAAIELARKAIVAAIRKIGDALIAIGDKVLAAFPALRQNFRAKIKSLVDKAEAAVNTLADKLKQGVQKLLDALGATLDAALDLLEKGLQAAIDLVGNVVQGAIKFADGVVKAVAGFAVLIKDVATSPLQWIKNLGASVVDGIRNHLWKAFKSAVQEWFNAKLEQVLGLGATVWNLLKSGGLAIAQIGQMAWEAIKAMIPRALVQILIEKLVAMIVPAAGAVMVIIEGLRAAWGTVSRIIQAFQLFMSFLKAVKSGSAGPKFAAALAAAAVAVIDFVANWLLIKLGKGLAKLGGKLKGIARRIAGKKKRGKKAKARGAKPQKAVAKSKLAPKKDQKPKRKDADKKKQDKEQKKQERMERAKRELPTKINPLLTNGVSTLALRLRLGIWRIRYRLSSLQLSSGGIYAKASPGPELITGAERIRRQRIGLALEPHLKEAEAEFFRQRRAEMSDKESRIIKEKERAIVGDTRDVLELATPEQIELFRRIRAGDIKLPAPKSGKRPGSVRHPLIRPGEPGFSVFINDPARLARAYVIGAGAYPIPHKRLGRPSVRGLVHALEPARSEGLFAAGQVAHGLEKLGLATPHETHTGSLAPMAVEASAIAAERDIGISPATSKFDHSEEEAARLTRHERIGNIFARLNRLIDDPPVDIVSKSGSAKALTNLASAFQEWLKVHFPYNNAKSSEKEIKRAVNELMAQLVIFLQTVSSRRDE